MLHTILLVGLSVFFLSGCITTKNPSDLSKLQMKVTQLERKVEEKDEEIAVLQDELKGLNAQIEDVESSASAARTMQEPQEYDSQPTRAIAIEPVTAVSSKDSEIIRVPASSQEVQRALKNAGYYDGAIDGKIGDRTKKAIISFQKDHNLNADGIIGRRTWQQLKSYLNS